MRLDQLALFINLPHVYLFGGDIPFETLLFMIAFVDIFGGLLLLFNSVSLFHIMLFYFGFVILIKGLWTVFSSAREKFYFDYLGWIDVSAGAIMLMIFFNESFSFLWFFGIAILIKGLWSVLNAI